MKAVIMIINRHKNDKFNVASAIATSIGLHKIINARDSVNCDDGNLMRRADVFQIMFKYSFSNNSVLNPIA